MPFDPISYALAKRALRKPVGARKLSELEIDVDKDWLDHIIFNGIILSPSDGSDGDLTVSSNTTLNAGEYNYDELTINSGVTLSVGTPTIIRCNLLRLYGTISAKGLNTGDGLLFELTPKKGGDASLSSHGGGGAGINSFKRFWLVAKEFGLGGAEGGKGTTPDGAVVPGGKGGGVVVIIAKEISSDSNGVIDASGENGANGGDYGDPGGGGGGGGGGLAMVIAPSIPAISILAKGGRGGNGSTGTYNSGGGGGGGGGIIVTIAKTDNSSKNVSGGGGGSGRLTSNATSGGYGAGGGGGFGNGGAGATCGDPGSAGASGLIVNIPLKLLDTLFLSQV